MENHKDCYVQKEVYKYNVTAMYRRRRLPEDQVKTV